MSQLNMILLFLAISLSASFPLLGQEEIQDEDAFFIKKLYDRSLTDPAAHQWLEHLCKKIGGRLSGSENAVKAVDYTARVLDSIGMNSVIKQPCEVPHWVRGEKELVQVLKPDGSKTDLSALALGNSIGTGPNGIEAKVIEVKSLDEVENLGKTIIEGKIVFYNRPMDPTQIRTFHAYGGAVDQRVYGASKAAEYGAVGVLVRSMTTRTDDFPHTGVNVYKDGVKKIPAIAISTIGADRLSKMIKEGELSIFIRNNSEMLDPEISHNVIGEWTGNENPNEIILVGGHLDSWDVGEGAHDDGAGCVQAMDALRLLKVCGYTPNRTLRAVMFMNEENGLGGALAYAKASNEAKEFHLAAIESDAGGFSPRAFACDAEESVLTDRFKKLSEVFSLLEPYGLSLTNGGGGADINPLKSQKGILIGLRPDSQRYFDFHHAKNDTFEAVNQRELQLGAAAMASLIYLIDKYGL